LNFIFLKDCEVTIGSIWAITVEQRKAILVLLGDSQAKAKPGNIILIGMPNMSTAAICFNSFLKELISMSATLMYKPIAIAACIIS
jgi:hypothetical protein